MQLVETTLSPVQRRTGAAWVTWTDLVDQQIRRGEPFRVLAPGDDVMLQVDGGAVHRGWVLRLVGSGSVGAYVIAFGAAISSAAPGGNRGGHDPVVQDVELRVVPAQPPRSVSLYL